MVLNVSPLHDAGASAHSGFERERAQAQPSPPMTIVMSRAGVRRCLPHPTAHDDGDEDRACVCAGAGVQVASNVRPLQPTPSRPAQPAQPRCVVSEFGFTLNVLFLGPLGT